MIILIILGILTSVFVWTLIIGIFSKRTFGDIFLKGLAIHTIFLNVIALIGSL